MEKREGRRVGVKRGQGRKRERLRDGLIFYFHFPNGCSSQGRVMMKAEARSSILVYSVDCTALLVH